MSEEPGESTVILPSPGGKVTRDKPLAPPPPVQSNEYTTPPVPEGKVEALKVDQGLNGLVSGAATLIALLGKLRQTVSHNQVDRLYQDLTSEISQFVKVAQQDGYSSEIVLTTRYVLCSAIDEAVISTPWGVESGWTQKSLLSTFHNETSGGGKVFLILDRLLQAPAQNIDILELIYLCLSLGFEGKYKLNNRGRQELDALMANLYQSILSVRQIAETELSPHWQSDVVKQKSMADYVPLWVVAAFMAAVILLTYSGFRFWLHLDAKPVVNVFEQFVVNDKPESGER
ncbi:MAG: type IVB secretion system protein IcmH/DotU [Pseudomonadales bacterium]|nr:type IVB secretion system protein IcmH/DotU [Pseudomonadales bacterium]